MASRFHAILSGACRFSGRLSIERLESRELMVFDLAQPLVVEPFNNQLKKSEFGSAVATDSNFVVVGAHREGSGGEEAGRAYVFDVITSSLIHTLVHPAPAPGNQFGYSVAVSGDAIVVGAHGSDQGAIDSGMAFIFDATTGALRWTLANPTPSPGDYFGYSVAISGNTVIVGALGVGIGGANVGAVYIFDATTGDLVRELVNPRRNDGTPDYFGSSVAVSENRVIVGAYGADVGAIDAGIAYVFDAKTGDLLTAIVNPEPTAGDLFGYSVSASQDFIAIGSRSTNAQSVWIFDATLGGLLRVLANPQPLQGGRFGYSVSVSGNTVVAGAYGENPRDIKNAGVAYVFDAITGDLKKSLTSPKPNQGDLFGWAVSVSGDNVVVGASLGERNDTGSAYVFSSVNGSINPETFGNVFIYQGSTRVFSATIADPYYGAMASGFSDSAEPEFGNNRAIIEFAAPSYAWADRATLKLSNINECCDIHKAFNFSLYGYVGDNEVTPSDYDRAATPIGSFSGEANVPFEIDITQFYNSMIARRRLLSAFEFTV